ncbi:MAG TPA: M20/M25/M40 family metallo-hydrolase, partial [Kofleriaceae bacterium]|nr:M20/M25/M40 family metallo-hydrolase [Kofleriaceae bacterium]
DHLGIGPAIDGDAIYNGALDNAIGVAALLEVARAFKALPAPPRRSILFVAVTGEEKGLLGSEYFTAHPTVPLDHIVANVNIDGVTANWEVHDVVALGAEHSSLARQVDAAAAAVHLVVSPDPDPPQVYFIRSDQYSFVRHGIPAIFPGSGFLDAKGGRDVYRKLSDAWAEHHYHRPSDQWGPSYRAEWTLPELRFHFLVGLAIANAPAKPTWNPGDVFGTFVKAPLQ